MRFFWSAVAIMIVGLVIIWGVFFSGAKIKKNESGGNAMKSQGRVANPPAPESVSKSNVIVLDTNFGPIRIEVDPKAAPKTSENFKKLVSENFYDGLLFHRIVPGFVVQGGDPEGDGTGGPGYTVEAEIKLPHKRGSVAMARLGDAVNPERQSSGSQFYICLQDLPGLDGQYTVFGEVISGMEIVDMIARVATDAGSKPIDPVIIKRAYLE